MNHGYGFLNLQQQGVQTQLRQDAWRKRGRPLGDLDAEMRTAIL